MSQEEKKEKRKGLAGTLAVHGLLFLILFLYKIITPEPPPEEGGILINFGTSETGLGIQEEATTSSLPTVQQPSKEKEVVTQDVEPTVAIKKNEKKVVTPVKKESEKKQIEQVVNPKAIYKRKNSDSKSGNEGVTQGPGNQGDPNGDPSSPNYTGGKGDGIGSFDLKGRGIIHPPVIRDNSQETGKVVVDIVVDKAGNVTNVSIGRKTTTTNSHLQELALKAARETKFSSSVKGEEIQRGTITFVFVVQ
ncbi:MAG TPA: TonB family protein [Bacteroidia bacterium]|nr:TonB family protein [Bacteroidia bacterium]